MSENNPSGNSKRAKIKRRRGRVLRRVKRAFKILLLIPILLVAGLFGLKAYITNQAADSEDAIEYARAVVSSGPMSDTVYGTGTTSAKNQPSVTAETAGTLTELRVSIGDEVREGDVLAIITNEELDDTIIDYEFALWDLDDTILRTSPDSTVTNVKAPIAGRLVAVYAEIGDDALAVFRREGALAIISTDGRMKVELSDIPTSMGLTLGQTLRVRGDTVDEHGTVTELTMQGTHAVITVIGDSYPMGEAVAVTTLEGESVGSGTLEINKPMAVSAFGGTIKTIGRKVGQKIERRDILFQLDNYPLPLNLEDLRLQRETAARDLEEAKAQRENLIILAPCDGVVASLDVAEGDAIESGTVIGSILHGEDMKLTIAVDELDVVEVEIGQKVSITVDALPDTQLAGEVYKIAPVGTNSGGVTTYDVELSFDAAGTGVRSGMNATGEIEIASTSSTLYVPIEAIMTINNTTYVMVEDGGSQSLPAMAGQQFGSGGHLGGQREGMQGMGGMPQAAGDRAEGENMNGAMSGMIARLKAWLYEDVDLSAGSVTGSLVQVEVGMQNDDYAEILSGVSEGQVVLYTGGEESESPWNRGGMGGMRMGF